MNYRKDVDGLRSVAVLPVILYHVGLTAFSGGYVGVDIFFVISGYLITGIIYAEMAEGRFTISNFYIRRIKRIFPALYFMLTATVIMSLLLLLPKHLSNYGKSLISTVFFGSNIFFWKQSGYFDSAAETKPLLHTWSLGVEEQFYIFFPIFLYFLYKRGKSIRRVIAGVFFASFLMSSFLTVYYPESSFYLLHTRAWELMLGALIALGVHPKTDNKAVLNTMSFIGASLIAYSIFRFTSYTVFPGYMALVPCLGAGLIIASGINGQPVINRILGFKPLVFIGLISYSLYLWHWPLIAMRNYYKIVMNRAFFTSDWFIIGLTFLFASLSYFLVERPFRRMKVADRKRFFIRSAYIMILFTVIGSWVYFAKGLPKRMPDRVNTIAYVEKSAYRNEKCFYNDPMKTTEGNMCRMGDEKRKPSFILWGDSHSLALTDGLNEFANKNGLTGVFAGKSTCPPLMFVRVFNNETPSNCKQFNEIVYKIVLNDKNIKDVFLAARWELYAGEPTFGFEEQAKVRIVDALKKDGKEQDNLTVFRESLNRTAKGLIKAGKNVYFVMDVPEVPYESASELGKQEYFRYHFPDSPLSVDAYVALSHYMRRNRNVLATVKEAQAKTGLNRLDIFKVLCNDSRCRLESGGRALYYDDDHLSKFGSQYVVGRYAENFKKILVK